MKFKYLILTIFYLILCIVDCYFSNAPILGSINTGYFSKTDIFMSLHDSSNGYNGLLKISIVYILPIVLGIYFVSDREKFYYVIRYSVRSKYNTIRCLKVIIVSISFCIIHQIIDFIYIVYNFEFELLLNIILYNIRYCLLL